MIIASSSPTIIQKESTESVVSTPGAIGSPASPVIMQQQQQQLQDAVAASPGEQPAGATQPITAAPDANGAQAKPSTTVNYQSQYNLSTDRAHPLAAYLSGTAVTATAAAAAAAAITSSALADPARAQRQQLPTLATQIPAITAGCLEQGSASSHAPLSSSSTIRSASQHNSNGSPKKVSAADTTSAAASQQQQQQQQLQTIAARQNEIIHATELLLNALNQGDYETYTQLCDPHMTSFEPENLGNLIDNMEYRRLGMDQARQLQLQHLKATQDPRASAVATSAASRQYSIIMNPSVYLLGEDAASIAYTKLSQLISAGQLIGVEKSEETRIWHRKEGGKEGGKKLLCVHLHRSIIESRNAPMPGPQTSASLARYVANQQVLNQAPVPIISLNK